MEYTSDGRIVIHNGDLTNELLRRGHHIVQVRQDRTIFLFDGTEELKEDLLNIAREERIALKKELFD